MPVRGIGHVNLRASAETIERLRRFYVDVVGLREGFRPTFRSGSQGHWLYAGGTAVLHLTIAQNGGAEDQPRGAFDHLALNVDDLDAARARLEQSGIHYEVDVVDEMHQTQLFLTDPVGIGLELTFTQSGSR